MNNLTKGCEVEQYIGYKSQMAYAPLSHKVNELNNRFSVEPDARNIEYITQPCSTYEELKSQLIQGRLELRQTLKKIDKDLTIFPSSSLALPFDKRFQRSKPDNDYHTEIQKRHDINILTTSIHYNIGLGHLEPDEIIRLCNLLRLEASLILAITANSPFYNGEMAEGQSDRYLRFPHVPEITPIFSGHAGYIQWNEQMLNNRSFFNFRHLWTGIRPNGDNKPYEIDRLEVRIAESNSSWDTVLAVMAWIEMRVTSFIQDKDLVVPSHDTDLITLIYGNEYQAALTGLMAPFSDWIYAQESSHYDAIYRRLDDCQHIIEELKLAEYLKPLEDILLYGNESARKLELYNSGMTVKEIMADWIEELEQEDNKYIKG